MSPLAKHSAVSLLLIQGPNMSYLGQREPHIYGTTTASELDAMCHKHALGNGYELDIFYTHHEGDAIERVYRAELEGVNGIVMNPATFSRNGYGLVTCLRSVSLPYVEIHITNIEKRELPSITASVADGVVFGFGLDSYFIGLEAMLRLLNGRTHSSRQ
jgi:3-dehydroquinate dehydratase-2